MAIGFAEVAPDGARSQIVSLGNQVVADTSLAMARSGDGKAYLVVGWNAGVRTSFLVACSDGG